MSVSISTYIENLGVSKPVYQLQSPFWIGLKDCMDIVGALFALLLFAPAFPILYMLVRGDGGPAIYSQTRIGKNGKAFKCLKFRTMVVNSGEVLSELLESDAEARAAWEKDCKLKNDPRITKIGSFLRKSSLDELPQFWNVLRGDMSLVGPRPVLRNERKHYGACWDDYMLVKPGISGLWQVSGRNDTSYQKRIDLSSVYVREWSLGLDIFILIKTVFVVVSRRGAY